MAQTAKLTLTLSDGRDIVYDDVEYSIERPVHHTKTLGGAVLSTHFGATILTAVIKGPTITLEPT